MPTLVSTIGASDANSYLSIADADAIADSMVGTLSWTTATQTNKIRALISATSGLDTLRYIGHKASEEQALLWPRTYANCGDKNYNDEEIPREIELCTFDLAEALLSNPTLLRGSPTTEALVPGIPNRDLSRVKLDVLEVEWRTDRVNSTTKPITPLTVLPHLATILGCLTTSTTGTGSVLAVQRS